LRDAEPDEVQSPTKMQFDAIDGVSEEEAYLNGMFPWNELDSAFERDANVVSFGNIAIDSHGRKLIDGLAGVNWLHAVWDLV
jgi:hypothetical protein